MLQISIRYFGSGSVKNYVLALERKFGMNAETSALT